MWSWVEESRLLPPQKEGPWCNLGHRWELGAQALAKKSPARAHAMFRRGSSILRLCFVPVNQQSSWSPWRQKHRLELCWEGVQEMTLLPGSPCAGKELNARGSFTPVQSRNQSENRFIHFYCSEKSPANSLGLPAHILIAKISHKLTVYFSFDKVLFSNILN